MDFEYLNGLASIIGNLAQPVAVLIAGYGIVIAIRHSRRDAQASLFADYTARYEDIMKSLPDDALDCRFDSTRELPPRSQALTLTVLRYLNLCSEEYYLHRTGYLSDDLWEIWAEELKRMVCSLLLRREWAQLHSEFDSYTEFRRFIERIHDDDARAVKGASVA